MANNKIVRKLLKGQSLREWFVEFVRFCVVGLGSYIVDVGLFNLLAHSNILTLPGDSSMTAKTISVIVSVIFSWVVNRLWTFRDMRTKSKSHEFIMFVLVNAGGMLIALACLWFSRYVLDLRSQLADNISANVVGLVLGTAFRYVMYRYFVFSGTKSETARDGAPRELPEASTDEAKTADPVFTAESQTMPDNPFESVSLLSSDAQDVTHALSDDESPVSDPTMVEARRP
ncbi:GtrA family protein [Arcanobacterium haemolyticum]|nr:GtrA family protein [Arcanobacterium haemolyticum]